MNSKRKTFYIALSILLAVVVWIFVDVYADDTPRTRTKWFRDIPVDYNTTVLTERGLMLLDEGTDQTVDIQLEGTRWNIALLDRDDIRVTVNLADISATGEQTISASSTIVSFASSYFSGRLSVERRDPYALTVNIGELYSKTVDVRCEILGNVADGYSAGELQLSPTELEIRGDQADIDPVSYARVTLDLGEDATSTVSQELEIQFYDENDQLLDSSKIHSTEETVQATLPVYVTKELRLDMDFLEAPGARESNLDWEITPQTILVSGPAEILDNMDSIVLDQFNLLSLGETTNYSYAIPIPEGCENLSGVTRATLRVSFLDMQRTTVSTGNIEYINLADGKSATVLTEALEVTIFGTSADVGAVTADDITVLADLTDFSGAAGTYTVPAEIRVNGGDIGVSGGPYQVRVTITDQTPEENPGDQEIQEPPEEPPSTGEEA